MFITSGGHSHSSQLVEYDISNETFVDHGEDYLSTALANDDGEYGIGVYCTQLNSTTLYTISQNGDSIHVYDLRTLSYHVLDTTIPVSVGNAGCISSTTTKTPTLYITGGTGKSSDQSDDKLNELQILSLHDNQWMVSPPTMITSRHSHGCIVVNGILWAIGGHREDSVEAINTTKIDTSTWRKIGNLNCGLASFGVTAVDDLIFIVGGYTYCYDNFTRSVDSVYVINTVSNTIAIQNDTLPSRVDSMFVIAITKQEILCKTLFRVQGLRV